MHAPAPPTTTATAERRHIRTTHGFLDRYFPFTERRSSLRIEALGGFITFVTMSYILFVTPAILWAAGLTFSAVATATALGAAIAWLAMGLITKSTVALASAL